MYIKQSFDVDYDNAVVAGNLCWINLGKGVRVHKPRHSQQKHILHVVQELARQ